ncbi:hypothetical protein ACLBKU_07480 [Erythrobacter sp. NE805]|uniref:hypothetical protein n=1 Tax=Erythrobacter sp. NE805 TaxID=3389875 RepID=UPI00396B1829
MRYDIERLMAGIIEDLVSLGHITSAAYVQMALDQLPESSHCCMLDGFRRAKDSAVLQ